MSLLVSKPEGIYCPQGDFFIDPQRKVKLALVTHAHSDHAKKGSKHYLCTKETKSLIQEKITKKITAVPYKKQLDLNGVKVSFHPAGHIIGSAQIRVEHQGKVWVVSGDYKRASDPTCKTFESVQCDTFITETTFAKPHYEWKKTELIIEEILAWYNANKKSNVMSVLTGYRLGKSQRLIAELSKYTQVYYDQDLKRNVALYKKNNVSFNEAKSIEECPTKELQTALVITASSNNKWWLQSRESEIAFVSGWMHTSSPFKRGQGFALSDHVDWPDLLRTIEETKARHIIATHGASDYLVPYLQKKGLHASVLGKPEKIQVSLLDYFHSFIN